jgi:inner membrane protein
MSPVTHLLISWLVANTVPGLERRERALIAIAGIAPDIDGFGAPIELLTKNSDNPLMWFSNYHHILCHNALFCIVLALVFGYFSRNKRISVGFFALLTAHGHLICDLIGSMGPDGSHWPIPYLLPFSDAFKATWDGQWELTSWQNYSITALALATTFWLAIRRGYSPVEIVSPKADKVFVATLRGRADQISELYEIRNRSQPKKPDGFV